MDAAAASDGNLTNNSSWELATLPRANRILTTAAAAAWTSEQNLTATSSSLLATIEAEKTAIDSRRLAATIGIALALYGITLFTVLGNALVIISVFYFRHLRSVGTNWFIASLATADFLVALLVMSLAATNVVIGYWPFGPVICQIHAALDIMLSTASIFNLCVISLERYWAVMRPYEYTSKMTKRKATAMIAAAWTFSALVSALQLTTSILVFSPQAEPDGDGGDLPQCVFDLNAVYAVVSSTISFYIPSIIMIAVYQKIFRTAREIEKQIRSQDRAVSRMSSKKIREQKATRTLGIIMGVFITCWTPFFVINCLYHWSGVDISDTSFLIVTWLGWINSGLNPVIYATNREFRRHFRRLLFCGKCADRDRKSKDYYYSYYTGAEVTSPRMHHRVNTINAATKTIAKAPPIGNNSRVHHKNFANEEELVAATNGHKQELDEEEEAEDDQLTTLQVWTPYAEMTSTSTPSETAEKTSVERPATSSHLLQLDYIRRESTV